MKERQNRQGNINLQLVCLWFVNCGNNLCYFTIEMFGKVFTKNCNTIGEVNATKNASTEAVFLLAH